MSNFTSDESALMDEGRLLMVGVHALAGGGVPNAHHGRRGANAETRNERGAGRFAKTNSVAHNNVSFRSRREDDRKGDDG